MNIQSKDITITNIHGIRSDEWHNNDPQCRICMNYYRITLNPMAYPMIVPKKIHHPRLILHVPRSSWWAVASRACPRPTPWWSTEAARCSWTKVPSAAGTPPRPGSASFRGFLGRFWRISEVFGDDFWMISEDFSMICEGFLGNFMGNKLGFNSKSFALCFGILLVDFLLAFSSQQECEPVPAKNAKLLFFLNESNSKPQLDEPANEVEVNMRISGQKKRGKKQKVGR